MFHNRLKTHFIAMLLCHAFLALSPSFLNAANNLPEGIAFNQHVEEGTPPMEIVIGARGIAYMSWTPFGTSGEYSVTVTDLTNFVVLASFSTSNTTATVNGHISGHTYRYMVTDGVDFVVEDVVH